MDHVEVFLKLRPRK